MNFGFTDEQELLRAEVRKFLDARAPLEKVRQWAETPEGFSREIWKQVAELGWPGLLVAEPHGGAGLGFVELTVVLEEAGRTLFPSPLLATTLAAATLQDEADDAQQGRWLPTLADGSRIGTVALVEAGGRLDPAGIALRGERTEAGWRLSGRKQTVIDAAAADLFVVAFRSGEAPELLTLGVVERDAPGVSAASVPGLDPTQRLGTLTLDGARVAADAVVGEPGAAWPAIRRLLDRGAAAVTAEAIGAAEGVLRLTVDYARQREQFGSPIGRFQGVKHPLAEMYVDVESAKSLLYWSMWCLQQRHPEASRAVSMAKAYASEAFARIGIDAIQLHGGIGYTWEYDAQLYLKRSKWVRPMFGDAAWHLDRVASEGGSEWTSI